MKYSSQGIISVMIFVLSLLSSCKRDFLEVEPKDTPVRERYVRDLTSCGEFLNGIYASLSESFCMTYNMIYPELVADNIKPATGGSSPLFLQYAWLQEASMDRRIQPTSGDVNMNALWTSGYQIVHSCNYLLENIDIYQNENETKANSIKGQALVLRALVMQNLMNVFAQPPFFTSDASHLGIPYDLQSDFTIPVTSRPTVRSNYDQLTKDLLTAIQLLPETQPSAVFISKSTAKGLLSRAYLNLRNYDQAKEFAIQVISKVPLLTGSGYPSKLFTSDEQESLLQLPPSVTATGSYTTSFPSLYFRRTIQFYASEDLVSILLDNPNDVRKNWIVENSGNWRIVKFPTGVVPGITTAENSYYLSLLRVSELYLIAAESYSHLSKTDSAQHYVNIIRKRADPNAKEIVASNGALIDSIYKERRKELCFEGMRMFDLLRTGRPVIRSSAISPASRELPYPSAKAIAPIPQVDVFQYGIKQNDNY